MMNSKVFYNFYLEKKLKLWKMKSFLEKIFCQIEIVHLTTSALRFLKV